MRKIAGLTVTLSILLQSLYLKTKDYFCEVEFGLDSILEIGGVIFGLLYLIFMIYEKIICWIFGIIGSTLSIWLFYRTQLYSESILYVYYVAIGFYGWFSWSKKPKINNEIIDLHVESNRLAFSENKIEHHLIAIVICTLLAIGLGWLFDNYTNAQNARLDAFTTIFSFYASFLEARKVVSAWIYWIILNGVTVYLYSQRELDIYALLTVVYFIASFIGYFQWRKKFRIQSNAITS